MGCAPSGRPCGPRAGGLRRVRCDPLARRRRRGRRGHRHAVTTMMRPGPFVCLPLDARRRRPHALGTPDRRSRRHAPSRTDPRARLPQGGRAFGFSGLRPPHHPHVLEVFLEQTLGPAVHIPAWQHTRRGMRAAREHDHHVQRPALGDHHLLRTTK